ncbi:MAG: AsmA family protein [Zetaproteobacteria bacterium]|nr:AsmA family protein [Zetaproteobacteria bacterium]
MMKRGLLMMALLIPLLVVGLLVLPSFVDMNNYKSMITDSVEDATGHKLVIGDMKLSLIPRVELKLSQVSLQGMGEFSGQTLASMQALDVQVEPWPLLSGKLQVQHFRLRKPEIYVEQRAMMNNWSDLLGHRATQTVVSSAEDRAAVVSVNSAEGSGNRQVSTVTVETDSAPSPLSYLMAEQLDIEDGRLQWRDAGLGQEASLEHLNFTVNHLLSKTQPMDVVLSFMLNGSSWEAEAKVAAIEDLSHLNLSTLPLQADLQVADIHPQAYLKIAQIFNPSLVVDTTNFPQSLQLKANLEQRPSGLRLSTGEVFWEQQRCSWSLNMPDEQGVQLQDVSWTFAGKAIAHLRGVVTLAAQPTFDLRVETETLQRAWLVEQSPLWQSIYPNSDQAWQTFSFGGQIAGDHQSVHLKNGQALFDQERMMLDGDISMADAANVRMQIYAPTLHLDPWIPIAVVDASPAPVAVEQEVTPVSESSALKVVAANGDAAVVGASSNAANGALNGEEGDAVAEVDLRILKDLQLHLRVKVDHLWYKDLQLKQLRGAVDGQNGEWFLSPLAFESGAEGRAEIHVNMDVRQYPIVWGKRMIIRSIAVEPLLSSFAGLHLLSGALDLDMKANGVGLQRASLLKSMVADSNVTLRDGKFVGLDMIKELRQLLRKEPASKDDMTAFELLSGTFHVENGEMHNNDLFLQSPELRLTGAGSIDLNSLTMNYLLKPRLVGSLFGKGDTVQVRKGLSIPLRVQGPVTAPKVTPEADSGTLLENVGGVLGGGALGVKDALQKGLGGLFQK